LIRLERALRVNCGGVGACESMIEQAVAYAQERKQFDRVVGSFQAVKHLCSEMIAELEPTRSLLWYAAHSFDTMPDEAPLMACHVLAHTSEIGWEIASASTQVQGGTGWTDEQNLHLWFKASAMRAICSAAPSICEIARRSCRASPLHLRLRPERRLQ
jgi:alkylation response protein AidB-like acyl-CoA dehydrogenase